jgi:hypothetical protein
MSKELNTVVEVTTFNNKPLLQIWKADEKGEKKGEYPLIAFASQKAQAIVTHADAIKEFAEKN